MYIDIEPHVLRARETSIAYDGRRQHERTTGENKSTNAQLRLPASASTSGRVRACVIERRFRVRGSLCACVRMCVCVCVCVLRVRACANEGPTHAILCGCLHVWKVRVRSCALQFWQGLLCFVGFVSFPCFQRLGVHSPPMDRAFVCAYRHYTKHVSHAIISRHHGGGEIWQKTCMARAS